MKKNMIFLFLAPLLMTQVLAMPSNGGIFSFPPSIPISNNHLMSENVLKEANDLLEEKYGVLIRPSTISDDNLNTFNDIVEGGPITKTEWHGKAGFDFRIWQDMAKRVKTLEQKTYKFLKIDELINIIISDVDKIYDLGRGIIDHDNVLKKQMAPAAPKINFALYSNLKNIKNFIDEIKKNKNPESDFLNDVNDAYRAMNNAMEYAKSWKFTLWGDSEADKARKKIEDIFKNNKVLDKVYNISENMTGRKRPDIHSALEDAVKLSHFLEAVGTMLERVRNCYQKDKTTIGQNDTRITQLKSQLRQASDHLPNVIRNAVEAMGKEITAAPLDNIIDGFLSVAVALKQAHSVFLNVYQAELGKWWERINQLENNTDFSIENFKNYIKDIDNFRKKCILNTQIDSSVIKLNESLMWDRFFQKSEQFVYNKIQEKNEKIKNCYNYKHYYDGIMALKIIKMSEDPQKQAQALSYLDEKKRKSVFKIIKSFDLLKKKGDVLNLDKSVDEMIKDFKSNIGVNSMINLYYVLKNFN